MTETSQTLALPSIDSAIALAGKQEENLNFISRHTGAKLILRGQDVVVYGNEKHVERSLRVINFLKLYWEEGKTITQPDIMTAFQALDTGRTDEYQNIQKQVLAKTRNGDLINTCF